MKKTFDSIDLRTDKDTDYSTIEVRDENRKAIDECEKDDFLPELVKISYSLPNVNLKNKYKSFITKLQKRYADWSDCIITSYDELNRCWDVFRDNNYDEYYFGYDKYEYDIIHDYFIEEGSYLFINPDALLQDKNTFANKDGKKYKNPYFRYVPIEDFAELDSRLLVVYADYFITRYRFARWFKSLSNEQLSYISRNVDKIRLTKNQRAMVTGDVSPDSFMTPEEKLEKALEIEYSDDLAVFTRGEEKYPCAGRLMSRMDLSFIDIKELSAGAFYYIVEHFWEKLGWSEKEDSSRRILVNYLLNDYHYYCEARLTGTNLPQHILNKNEQLWTIEEIIEFAPENKGDEEKLRKRLKIVDDFLYFEKWFNEKEVYKYRQSANNRYWTLVEAYNAVEDPRDPQLYVDGFSPTHARIA